MTKGKENKLQTPQSAQNSKKNRSLNLHSDPPPKKKKFQDSDDDSDIKNINFDKVIKKKLLSDKKVTPKINQNKKRSRDDDEDDDVDFLEINSDDSDLDEFDINGDSELEPSDEDDDDDDVIVRDAKRSKISVENKGKISVQNKGKISKENKKDVLTKSVKVDEAQLKMDLELKASRDKRTLIIKNLKEDLNDDDVNSLTKEIIAIRFVNCKSKSTKGKKCAFIEFADEATAEKNKKILTGKKFDGIDIQVDFVGQKSMMSNSRSAKPQDIVDPKVLFVSGLKTTVTEKEVMKLFPGCIKVDLAVSRHDQSRKDFVFVRYADETMCLEAHKLGQNMKHDGRNLVVQFARVASRIERLRLKKHKREDRRNLFQQTKAESQPNKDFNKIEKPQTSGQAKSKKAQKLSNQNKTNTLKPNSQEQLQKKVSSNQVQPKKKLNKTTNKASNGIPKQKNEKPQQGKPTSAPNNKNDKGVSPRIQKAGAELKKDNSAKKNKKARNRKNKNLAGQKSGDFIKL